MHIRANAFLIWAFLLLLGADARAQRSLSDSIGSKTLPTVTIDAFRLPQDVRRLEPVQGTYVYSGKKTEVVELAQKNVALTEKHGRQIFSKIPGIFVYDMDGTGNQLNISARGLDPHRGWEFNIRKDGILTNSDMYGYPASHYNIPMEAVERIELVRGSGSLQYGAQFGGMLSYVSKQPDTTQRLAFESINTVGSYGLLSTYNRASGRIGRFRYAAWMNQKRNGGYREYGDSEYEAQCVSLYYQPSQALELRLEWTRSYYYIHLAGPLTDSMFRANPQMGTRSRNYYSPDIHVPSFSLFWQLGPTTRAQATFSAALGARNSVLFDRPATVPDTLSRATLTYATRQVDIDRFNSYTAELRMLHTYSLLRRISTLSAGVQYMNNDLHRRQQGVGSRGSDFDLGLILPGWGRDLHFRTRNLAVFAENQWQVSRRFSLNTGTRIENGQSNMSGMIVNYPANELPHSISHRFPLFAVSTQYEIAQQTQLYGSWSQAYRPVIFKDIIPASPYERTDKHLKNAYGYNGEIGFRGAWKFLTWDITGFILQYNNRMGNLVETDDAGNLLIIKTNIGDSRTLGAEWFLQGDLRLSRRTYLSAFSATSRMDARYQRAVLRSGSENVSVSGNWVESVPEWISRNGLTVRHPLFSATLLYSYVSETFADALNTVQPNASGSVGMVPAYGLLDMNASLQLSGNVSLQLNANNVLNRSYFTKRPQFYPGPGIWPSDGRSFSATLLIGV